MSSSSPVLSLSLPAASISSPISSTFTSPSSSSSSFTSTSESRNRDFLVTVTERAISHVHRLQRENVQYQSDLSSASAALRHYQAKIEQLQESLQLSRLKPSAIALALSPSGSLKSLPLSHSASSSLSHVSVDSSQSTLQSVQAELSSSRAEIADLKSQIHSLQRDLSLSQSVAQREILLGNAIQNEIRLESALKQIQRDQEKMKRIQEENQELRAMGTGMGMGMGNHHNGESKENGARGRSGSIVLAREEELNALKKEIERMNRELVQRDNRLESNQSALNLANEDKERLKRLVSLLKSDKEQWQSQLAHEKEIQKQLETKLHDFQHQLDDLKRLEGIQELCKVLEREKKELKKKYEMVWSKCLDYQSINEENQAAINMWKGKAEEWEKKCNEYERERARDRERDGQRRDRDLEELAAKSGEEKSKMDEIQEWKQKAEQKDNEIAKLKKYQEAVEKELVSAENRLGETQIRVKQLEESNRKLTDAGAAGAGAKEAIEALRKSMEAAEKSNAKLEQRLKAQEESSKRVAKAAAELETAIAKLEVNEGANEVSLTCTCCMKLFSGDVLTLSPCSHSFDQQCFLQLPAEERVSCPQCQKPVDIDRSITNSLLSELASKAQFRHQALSGLKQLLEEQRNARNIGA